MRATAVALLLWCGTSLAAPPDASRGELLYENHCHGCHLSSLHVRKDHKARSEEDVANWVLHWSKVRNLGWSEEDVLDVTDFLTMRYYAFSSPPPPPGPKSQRPPR